MSNGAHVVGSLNLPDARTLFETVSREAGDVVATIPDGETGDLHKLGRRADRNTAAD